MQILKRIARKVARDLRKFFRLRQASKMGIAFVEPNFLYWPRINPGDKIVDAGCSYEADFSVFMIERYGAMSYAVDPTRKHRQALEVLKERYLEKFMHLPIAVGPNNGELIFHESEYNESGSLLESHTNIKSDKIKMYKVPCVTLKKLAEELGFEKIAILKLDIEGAEYSLLENVEPSDLAPFDQIFIEFHHHAVSDYSVKDTKKIVHRFYDIGFKSFSIDDTNYLFWRGH